MSAPRPDSYRFVIHRNNYLSEWNYRIHDSNGSKYLFLLFLSFLLFFYHYYIFIAFFSFHFYYYYYIITLLIRLLGYFNSKMNKKTWRIYVIWTTKSYCVSILSFYYYYSFIFLTFTDIKRTMFPWKNIDMYPYSNNINNGINNKWCFE